MQVFTGKSINMSIQEALDDAVRQAALHKAEGEHELIHEFEILRIYGVRTESMAFRTLNVEIEVS
jgi:hypothetical protein